MSKLTSTNYSQGLFNVGTLALRLTFGLLLFIRHGLPKLRGFSSMQHTFYDPFHIGSRWSLCLVIFAEVFCAVLVVLGFVTRFAAIPIVISLTVALFLYQRGQGLANTEMAWVYWTAFVCILLLGPGRISIDGLTK